MGVVVEEANESVFWLELLVDARLMGKEQVQGLLNEANELVAIFVASRQTARSK